MFTHPQVRLRLRTPLGEQRPVRRMSDSDAILEVICRSIDEVNEQQSPDQRVGKALDTVLLGEGSPLESLGVVNLIVALEQNLEQRFGVSVSLTEDERLYSSDSPLGTVRSLVGHLAALLASRPGA